MKPNNIYLGDCLDLMAGIDDHSIDMILADLPYGTTACAWDSIIPLEPLWAHYKRVIKRNGAIVLTGQEPFASYVRCSQPSLYKYDWYLKKHKPTNPQQMKARPGKMIEVAMVFYKQLSSYNPQKTVHIGARVSNRPSKTATFGALSGNTNNKIIPYNDNGLRYPIQLIPFGKIPLGNASHETQKSVSLFAYLIRTYTNSGDIVLDNVIGSGTTAIAAIETGRQWIGIEKDEGYYNAAKERIEKRLQQPFLIEPGETEKPQQLMFGG